MTDLIEKTDDRSNTIRHDSTPEINKSHFLMDEELDRNIRSQIIAGRQDHETCAKVYDEYTPAHDRIMVSENSIFPFKPVYDKWEVPSARKYSFNSIQKWEGVVTKVVEGSFFARLVDITDPTNNDGSEEIIEIPNEDVSSKDDLELIVPGAIFYWNIGYQTVNGQDSKASIITFRRLPKWTAKKLESIRQKGKFFVEGLVWE